MRIRFASRDAEFHRRERRQASGLCARESGEHVAASQRSEEFQAIGRPFAGLIEFDLHQCEVVHMGEAKP